jgi:hypothetical protein
MTVFRAWCCVLSCFGLLAQMARGEIVLLGEVQIAAESSDLSGLSGTFEDGVPFNRFGGISAIEHLEGDQYVLLPDRGPSDGAVPYATRFHLATIHLAEAGSPLTLTLNETRFFHKGGGQPLVGSARALKKGKDQPGRFDPEGLRIVRRAEQDSVLAVSDEYGPRVDLYDMKGNRIRKLKVPERFEIDHPSGDAAAEARDNRQGRQPNAGFESLAISPDGATLYTMIQRPVIQDGALVAGRFTGRLNRILRIDVATNSTVEFAYPLDSPDAVVCEMLCVDDHRLLVLERDSISGKSAQIKRIAMIDLHGASDISQIESLPSLPEELPAGVACVTKRPFLDLLDPRFGIFNDKTPSKFEGLTFGPDLADGRKTLLVSVDNDFKAENPTRIFAFAFTPDEFTK